METTWHDKKIILLVAPSPQEQTRWQAQLGDQYLLVHFELWQEAYQWLQEVNFQVDVILSDMFFPFCPTMEYLTKIREKLAPTALPFIIYSEERLEKHQEEARRRGVNDFYQAPFEPKELKPRIETLIKLKRNRRRLQIKRMQKKVRTPWPKRLFDIVSSATALLIASPVMLLLALLIRLESKGPVLYASKRVGRGYQIFPLYKFRTMYQNADQMVDKLKHLNVYQPSKKASGAEQCKRCKEQGQYCSPLLYHDGRLICEYMYKQIAAADSSTFVKFKNDPRITKVGAFLRNTSLDELPQLINIFKGDMSLVGNRPLPLYEAEQLTTDEALQRFLAPAGLTGLWQVSKRGKAEMSIEERIALDNEYARKYSLWMDFKIILRTFPALFQHENV